MAIVKNTRLKLVDVEKRLETSYEEAMYDADKLRSLFREMHEESMMASKKKYMAQVRLYDKYGFKISRRMDELKFEELHSMADFGVF